MPAKQWEQNGDRYILKFTPFYHEEVVAELYQDEECYWYYDSTLTGDKEEYLATSKTCLHDAKLLIEEMIYSNYEGKRDYYQEMMDKFSK